MRARTGDLAAAIVAAASTIRISKIGELLSFFMNRAVKAANRIPLYISKLTDNSGIFCDLEFAIGLRAGKAKFLGGLFECGAAVEAGGFELKDAVGKPILLSV